MGVFNRNIITEDDIAAFLTAQTINTVPRTLDVNPPAGARPPTPEGAPPPPPDAVPPPAQGGVGVPTQDDYLTKLVKYVPLEVLGAYLFLAGIIESNVTDASAYALWLGILLLGMLVITALYDIRVLRIVRPAQVVMSVVGMTIYVFAVGGWFATTTWYEPWYASIALPLFGLLVAIVRLSPLPPPPPNG